MKTSKNSCKFFATLCTGLLLTACTGEELLTDTATEGTGRVMYATAAYNENNSPKTRMSYKDDLIKNYMTLAWSAGDAFSAFISTDATNTKHEFAIVAPEAGKDYTASEKFKCSDFSKEIADGTVIDAIYPSSSVSSETSLDPKNVTLSLAAQTQAKHKDTEHLKQYDYMVGHAIYHSKTPEELNFSFTDHGDGNAGRLASIYRVTLTLPAGVGKVNSIKLTATDDKGNASLTDALALNFAKGAISTVPRSHNGVTLTVTDGITDTSDGNNQFIAYVMLYPSLIKTLTTEVKTDVGIFTKTETYGSEIVSTRGEFKLIAVDMTGVTPTIPDYTAYNEVGTGTAEDPYLILNETQLRDWATQNNNGNIAVKQAAKSRATSTNEEAYFKLVYDISLTANENGNWTPIGTDTNPFTGYFDGNGKSVTGMTVITTNSPHNGFIGRMTAGELKDVTVVGTVNVTNTTATTSTFAGGLVASLEGGTLSGTLKSDVIVTASSNGSVYAGGLVGAKKDEATIDKSASLSATGAVSATISNPTNVTTVEIGAGSVIGNGTKEENTIEGAGKVTTNAPEGTTIVKNGVSNKVDIGFTLNPWNPVNGGNLGTE